MQKIHPERRRSQGGACANKIKQTRDGKQEKLSHNITQSSLQIFRIFRRPLEPFVLCCMFSPKQPSQTRVHKNTSQKHPKTFTKGQPCWVLGPSAQREILEFLRARCGPLLKLHRLLANRRPKRRWDKARLGLKEISGPLQQRHSRSKWALLQQKPKQSPGRGEGNARRATMAPFGGR